LSIVFSSASSSVTNSAIPGFGQGQGKHHLLVDGTQSSVVQLFMSRSIFCRSNELILIQNKNIWKCLYFWGMMKQN